MDLSSIMNSDAAGTSRRPPSPPSHRSPSQVTRKPSEPIYPTHDQPPSSSSYPSGYPNGLSQQPPPLQRAQTSPDRNSSYGSLQSPYEYNAPSSLNAGAPTQRGHSPPAAPYGPSASRDSHGAPVSYPHPQHHPSHQQSPIVPQRSHSIQSVLTPYSSAPHPFAHRDSPPAAPQHPYPSQQFSPATQGSLPGTPRGSAAAVYHHSTPSSARPQSSGHDSLSNRASSPWVGQDAQMHMSPTTIPRIARQDSRALDNTPRRTSSITERRESDESVSPKTAFPPDVRRGSVAEHGQQPTVVKLHDRENGAAAQSNRPPAQDPHTQPAPTAPTVSQGTIASESPKGHPGPPRPPPKANFGPEMGSAHSSPQQPKRKRRRYNEPPIYAQRTIRTKGKCPMIPNRLAPIPKNLRNTPQNPWVQRQQAATNAAPPSMKIKREDSIVNGPPISSQQLQLSRSSQPPQSSEPTKHKSLGPWEPSIVGYIPYEETTKIVCDFLFQHVVLRNDAMAGPAGASAVGQGAIIEVEAKLGQLMDLDRRERLHLPVQSETVIDRDNPRFRTSFESNMTQAQHRAMNNFLNETVKNSMPQADPNRIPLSYAHKKERDSFYEVSPSELPPIIRQNLNPRHKPKVRVTHDQRTGELLAKIVKCRVADLDIYSPRTCVDWRISVNLEMSYDGDVSHLPPADTGRGASDRIKDRMSYRHLAYQVDLTQVARSEPSAKGEFEHELEVEVSAAEIRRQGQLAMSNDLDNQYEDLVKGLVDNIRILARAVPA
ncbi:putative mRNA capping nucleoside-triphosphatase [Aspergillus undulatus]|uniref:putative mRNA capping nucleoside-triphosphatase n=1 Tax=Aspergillus undulatus TaxID=1810928 RepID=UPI003CCD479F